MTKYRFWNVQTSDESLLRQGKRNKKGSALGIFIHKFYLALKKSKIIIFYLFILNSAVGVLILPK